MDSGLTCAPFTEASVRTSFLEVEVIGRFCFTSADARAGDIVTETPLILTICGSAVPRIGITTKSVLVEASVAFGSSSVLNKSPI